MPDSFNLRFLHKLREKQNINLEQMASACGLHGKRSRISVGKWEQGKAVPHKRHRLNFLDYLVRYLKIEFEELQTYWEKLEAEWGWDALKGSELNKYFFFKSNQS